MVAVPSGGAATFTIDWSALPTGGEAACPTSSQLKVTPPGEFDPIFIPARMTACGGGRLDVGAISPTGSVSRNWSGYAATGGTFTGVAATWTVPAPIGSAGPSASATWVGIGGANTRDLIHAGTEDLPARLPRRHLPAEGHAADEASPARALVRPRYREARTRRPHARISGVPAAASTGMSSPGGSEER